ncbi:thiol-disulfide isomerase/thioredoxin [Pacificibacter maritimus]|uniref:Thiol-disulfide isomerase/thioredoxin n=1 Tax=Pacificibacter maritimus TaxID=762213 RepID=A0A3N4UMG0_9RHOB|nr:TlpA disulfide reductase family protein [Pacificibacter maritimus]RPE66247.1 thiol-disulfide isomerase/thioredoxin [Pacificibacter maritimus]
MFKMLKIAFLYTALSLTAIAAQGLDMAKIDEMRAGSMRKLVFHKDAKDVSQLPFTTPEGEEFQLSDFRGDYILLNFWATWCVPCRTEMPDLDALAKTYDGKGLKVLTVASGHNPLPAITKFYRDANLETLPTLLDPKGSFSRDMEVLFLPITVLISPEGQEVARMKGDAEWFSEDARLLIDALIQDSAAQTTGADHR